MTGIVIGTFQVILVLLAPFLVPMLLFYLYYYVRGKRQRKGLYRFVNHGSKIKRLFWDFPKRFVLDRFDRDPDMFREYGVHLICGEQGSGKTVALTYMLMRYQKMYPLMRIKTNYAYTYQHDAIHGWEDLVASENGIYGEIDVLDEIQNWFNSNQSKNFPPEMLGEISQQRKQKKCVFGTSQVFSRVAKPIREQVTFLYKPFTLFGCLTVVRVYKPKMSSNDGQLDDEKLRRVFFFVHSDALRNAFDTYHKIEMLVGSGFRPVSEQYRNTTVMIDTAVKDA